MSAHVHVETFPAAWPDALLSTFNLIASLRRALGDMSRVTYSAIFDA